MFWSKGQIPVALNSAVIFVIVRNLGRDSRRLLVSPEFCIFMWAGHIGIFVEIEFQHGGAILHNSRFNRHGPELKADFIVSN